ncbi:MAG: efflux RND transporter periplasmic adaptor subunit, partial [Candidatus Rokuibacteriota bacterium]
VALAVAWLAGACSRGPEGPAGQPAVPVSVATAVQKPVPVQLRAIGNAVASTSVTVRARVSGILAGVHFEEGQDVSEGDLLFTLDRAALEAQLREAQADLARSVAQLENARRDAERYAELVRRGFVAQQEYDRFRTAARTLEATVRADRAAVDSARVQLGYTTIRAPISGRTGALGARPGDLVDASETPLVVINQLRPMEVAFALPEGDLAAVRRYQAEGTLGVEAVAPRSGEHLAEGELTFIDNRVDPATATIRLRATFPNRQLRLWPGQFVNVVLTLTVEPAAVVVPTAAVETGQEGPYVFVVKPDQTVEARPVTVAREVAQEAVIAEGVRAGETVVTDGQLRLVPGAKVEPRSAAAAAPAPSQP